MALKDVLPQFRVHLLAGVRDAGKTRFILPAMIEWAKNGGPPWAYVAGDRSLLDAQDTIRDMNYQLSDVPLIAAYGKEHKGEWSQVVNVLMRQKPIPQVAVIEAFQDLAESINKRNVVHMFMQGVDAYLQPGPDFPQGLTVVGLTGAPKQGPRDRYPDPSQRIPGTSIWGERASTLLVVESANEKTLSLTGPERKLFVCRKHGGPRLELNGTFTVDNRLIFPAL